MALDTREKRQAVMAAGWIPLVILPVGDGTIDADDRLQVMGFARTIGAGSSPDPPPTPDDPNPIQAEGGVRSPLWLRAGRFLGRPRSSRRPRI